MTKLFEPEGPDETGEAGGPLWSRYLWFAGLMLAGLVVVGATAYVLRALLFMGT